MKKIINSTLSLIIIATIGIIISCKKSETEKKVDSSSSPKEETKDTINTDFLNNEKIQDTFFDATYGDSKEKVLRNLKAHGFKFIQLISNDTELMFSPQKSQTFSFGNMSWNQLYVGMNNNKFCRILFVKTHKEKEAAKSNYESILSTVSKKYKLIESKNEDNNYIETAIGLDNKGHCIAVSYGKDETISGKMTYISILAYMNSMWENEVSDEI